MKYSVGDLVLLKKYDYKPRQGRLHRRQPQARRRLPFEQLENTFGIITKIEKHSDIFEKHSTEVDNAYYWFSQLNEKEYHFYEDEIIGEII